MLALVSLFVAAQSSAPQTPSHDLRLDSRCSWSECGWERELAAFRGDSSVGWTQDTLEHWREHCELHGWPTSSDFQSNPMVRDVARCPKQALDAFESVLDDPHASGPVEVWWRLAIVFESNGRHEATDRALRIVLGRCTPNVGSYVRWLPLGEAATDELWARIHIQRGEWQAAVDDQDEARRARANSAPSHCGNAVFDEFIAWCPIVARCLAEVGRECEVDDLIIPWIMCESCEPIEQLLAVAERTPSVLDVGALERATCELLDKCSAESDAPSSRHEDARDLVARAIELARKHREVLALDPRASIARLAELGANHEDEALLRVATVGDDAVEELLTRVDALQNREPRAARSESADWVLALLARTGVPRVGEFLSRRAELASTGAERERTARDVDTWTAAAELRNQLEFGITR